MATSPRVTATIDAVDRASPVIAAAAQEALKAQSRFGRTQAGLTKELQVAQSAHAAALKEYNSQITRANDGLFKMRDLLKGMALYKLGSFAASGLQEAAAIQDQQQRALLAGLTSPEAARIRDIAITSAGKYPMNSVHEGEQVGVELRGVLSKSEDVETALPVALKAAQALKALGEHSEGLAPLFKAAEMAGVANDPKRLENFIDSFVRGKSLYHEMITPELYRSTFAAARVSAMTMSDDYRNRVMPLMIAEMNQGAGVGQNMVMKQAVGGFAGPQHAALKTWVDLGLIDSADVEWKKGEATKLKTESRPRDIDLMQSNLAAWVGSDFLPAALKKLQIRSDQLLSMDQSEAMRKLAPLTTQAFPNGRAADEVAKVLQGLISGALERHREMLDKSHGLGAADEAMTSVSNAMEASASSAKNLIGVLTTPAMDDAAAAFGHVSQGLGAMLAPLHEFQKSHPNVARGAAIGAIGAGGLAAYGGLTAILNKLTGVGAIKAAGLELHASALALDRAAAALTTSAERQSVAKAAGAAEGAAAGAAAEGAAANGTKAGWLAGAAGFSPFSALVASQIAASVKLYEQNRRVEAYPDGFTIGENGDLIPNPPSTSNMPPLRPHPAAPSPTDWRASYKAPPVPSMLRPPVQGPELPRFIVGGFEVEAVRDAYAAAHYSPYEQKHEGTFEAARGRALSALPPMPVHVEPISVNGTVEGKVTGSTDVHGHFTVEPSPLLVSKLAYLETHAADLNGNLAGRVGSSMSGANAPRATHGAGIGHM